MADRAELLYEAVKRGLKKTSDLSAEDKTLLRDYIANKQVSPATTPKPQAKPEQPNLLQRIGNFFTTKQQANKEAMLENATKLGMNPDMAETPQEMAARMPGGVNQFTAGMLEMEPFKTISRANPNNQQLLDAIGQPQTAGETLARGAGGIAGGIPLGVAFDPLGLKVASAVGGAKALSKASPLVRSLVTGAARGAAENTAQEVVQQAGRTLEQRKIPENAGKQILAAAGMGGVIGGTFSGVGYGLGALGDKLRAKALRNEVESITKQLDNAEAQFAKMSSADNADEQTLARLVENMEELQVRRDQLQGQINTITLAEKPPNYGAIIQDAEAEREKIIAEYTEGLKRGIRGVEQGGVSTDTEGGRVAPGRGQVIFRWGRQSLNDPWYQKFYANEGRRPTQKEFRNLAIKYLSEGGAFEGEPPNARFLELEEIIADAKANWMKEVPISEIPRTEEQDADYILKHMSIGEDRGRGWTPERVYSTVFDEFAPIERATKELSGGVDLNPGDSPIELARLSKGSGGKAQSFIDYGVFDSENNKIAGSLKEALAPVRDDIQKFRAYIGAKRAVELAGRGIETGMDSEEVSRIAKSLETPVRREAFDNLIKFQDAVLKQTLVDAGVTSPEAFTAMKELNQSYVPFYRLFEGETGGIGVKGFQTGSQIKRIKGSERIIVDPLESVIRNTYAYTSAADRNRVAAALAELAHKNADGNGWLNYIGEMDIPKDFGKQLKLVLGDQNLTDEQTTKLTQVFAPYAGAAKDNVVSIWRNGKRELYKVDPDLYASLTGMDRETSNLFLKIIGFPAKVLRAGATLALEFMGRNPVRDQWTAYINSKYGYTPVVDLFRGLSHAIKGDDLYQEWLRSGGAQSTMVSLDREYLQRSITDVLSGDSIWKKVARYATSPLETLRAISEFAEEGTRIGEFGKAKTALLKQGMGIEDALRGAASASRDVTVDFSRRGSKGQIPNTVIPFFNAALQSLDKMRRTFQTNPKGTTVKVLASVTIPSVVLWAKNHDDPRYKDIPNWQKDLFWIIYPNDKPDAVPIRIPKPFEIGILFGTGAERMLDKYLADNPEAFKGYANTLKEALLPSWKPTIYSVLNDYVSNYNSFTDAPIVPAREENLPPEQQYGAYTSETAKLLGSVTGTSPRKLDFLVQGFGGGAGKTAVQGVDKILDILGATDPIPKPEKDWTQLPGVRGFTIQPGAQSKSVDDFYDLLTELKKKENGAKQGGERLSREEAKMLARLKSATDIMSALNKQERTVQMSRTMTPKEKERKLNEINVKQRETAQKALGR